MIFYFVWMTALIIALLVAQVVWLIKGTVRFVATAWEWGRAIRQVGPIRSEPSK